MKDPTRGLLVLAVISLSAAAGRGDATNNVIVNAAFKSGIASWEKISGPYTVSWANSVGATAPGALAVTMTGLFACSSPVSMSSAWRRWT